MGGMTSKSQQILALWPKIPDGPAKIRIIADKVGCRPAYVRVGARQRKGRGMSEIDARYLTRKYGGSSIAEALRNAWAQDQSYRSRLQRADRRYLEKRRASAPP